MGLFRDAGRRIERFKSAVTEAAEEEAVAECGDCGETVYSEREDCPECGSEDLRAVE